jgi:CO/xanthine dehydrogenase FAD-binding subunit
MEKIKSTVYYTNNLDNVLSQLKAMPQTSIYAACTQCFHYPEDRSVELPASTLIVRNIPELKTIERKERYIEIGAAVTMHQFLSLGKNRIPDFLYDAIKSVGTFSIRNIATIGGNICCKKRKMTLFAPLLALDAQLEFKSKNETISIPMAKFTEIPSGFLLSKIRIPLENWDISSFVKLGPTKGMNDNSASFTFLASTQKNLLSDIRIAFCGLFSLRSKEIENLIIGSRLPLQQRSIDIVLDNAEILFDENAKLIEKTLNPILKEQYLNLIRYNLSLLS